MWGGELKIYDEVKLSSSEVSPRLASCEVILRAPSSESVPPSEVS
jgi:hypothetical protein